MCTYLACYRGTTELQNLLYGPRVIERRETMFEDRTKAHADHVGQGLTRETTAAVGILKAVNFGDSNRLAVYVM